MQIIRTDILERLNHIKPSEVSTGVNMEWMVLKHIKEYPVVSDTFRAKILGCKKNTVRKWRDKHGYPPLIEKTCGQCKQTKSVNGFNSEDKGDGYQTICRICANNPKGWSDRVEELFRKVGW